MLSKLLLALSLFGPSLAIVCYSGNRTVNSPNYDTCITFEFGGQIFSAALPSYLKVEIKSKPEYRILIICNTNLCNYEVSKVTPSSVEPGKRPDQLSPNPDIPKCPLPSPPPRPTPACSASSETRAPVTRTTTRKCPEPSPTPASY